MRINLYAQNRHVVMIDGIPWEGFADGDYMEVEAHGNAATRTEGGDGPAMNLSAEQGGTITIGLLPTSPVIGAAYELRKAQQKNPRYINIGLITGTEEVISAGGCMFAKLPAFRSGGPSQQARQFVFEALQLKLDFTAMEPLDGGLL